GLDHTGWHFDAIEVFNAGVIWWQRGANRTALRHAQRLGVPRVGGSDSHALATVGRGLTLFPGSSVNDLYWAIQAGQTDWGGHYWSLGHYANVAARLIREHTLIGALRIAAADAGLIARQL